VPPARPFRATNGAKALLFALLLPITFFHRRRYPRLTPLLVFICFLGALSGCGAGRAIPVTGTTGGGTPTPAGTYTLTVSASAAGLTHSVNLTLVVQ
jgi:hypothetical protein